jgi:gamma-butyrobetaine dioxygenase
LSTVSGILSTVFAASLEQATASEHSDMARRMIATEAKGLRIAWPDGLAFTFHPIWLRERSFEASNKDPASGHRLQEVAFLPLDLAIESSELLSNGQVHLRFSDGHGCAFRLDDLRCCIEQPLPNDLVGTKQLWDARLDPLPWHDFATLSDEPALLALLDDLARLGLTLVRGMPREHDALQQLTDLIGPIRQTNWGGIADVKSIANPCDLSMTGRALEPHVDNPYRLPGPGYIFLHCLENSATGGESLAIDGFNAATRLQTTAPDAFRVLSTTPVTFRYADADAILEHFGPLIELRSDGQLQRVRFHNRSDQVAIAGSDSLSSYYSARRLFAELIWSDEMMLRFKLQPGEAYIVDNYRLLHGRAEIDLATGSRHMRQCYMDRDIVSSRQKVLRRRLGR